MSNAGKDSTVAMRGNTPRPHHHPGNRSRIVIPAQARI
jgi:hypothetical protein